MEERKDFIQWIKGHKKELIFAGISIGELILIVLGIKNLETLKAIWDSLQPVVKRSPVKVRETVPKIDNEIPPKQIQPLLTIVEPHTVPQAFKVSGHIRNLPAGCHASQEKIAEALKRNIIPRRNQRRKWRRWFVVWS